MKTLAFRCMLPPGDTAYTQVYAKGTVDASGGFTLIAPALSVHLCGKSMRHAKAPNFSVFNWPRNELLNGHSLRINRFPSENLCKHINYSLFIEPAGRGKPYCLTGWRFAVAIERALISVFDKTGVTDFARRSE